MHGALDYRVPDAQGQAYYNTLKTRGVDARFIVPRQPLGAEAAQQQALVCRVLRLARAP